MSSVVNGGQHQHQPMISPVIKEVELFVKAGKNGESLAGCPVCQRFFMVLLIKAEHNRDMSLVVTTVNTARPPPELVAASVSRLPCLRYGDDIISDPDEIALYIDSTFRYPPMPYDNVAAARACRDVFSKYSFYVKDVSHSADSLLAELRRLDAYLAESPHRFLCRDIPDHLDCLMLPKLHHIRVVAHVLKGLDIPPQLGALWGYLAAAYETPAFRNSCPSDQEIVEHWQSKPECPSLSKTAAAYYSTDAPPRYSFDVPAGIAPRQAAIQMQ